MSCYEHEGCERIVEALLDEIRMLRKVCQSAMKLPRPWIDGGVSWAEWDAAMSAIESAIEEKES